MAPAKKPKAKPRGRPFPKGVSGNKSGRPRLSPEQRQARVDAQAIIDAHTPDAAWQLVDTLLDEDQPTSARNLAAGAILDRASINGTTRVQLTGADGGPVQFDLKLLTDDQARKLRELVALTERKALPE